MGIRRLLVFLKASSDVISDGTVDGPGCCKKASFAGRDVLHVGNMVSCWIIVVLLSWSRPRRRRRHLLLAMLKLAGVFTTR